MSRTSRRRRSLRRKLWFALFSGKPFEHRGLVYEPKTMWKYGPYERIEP